MIIGYLRFLNTLWFDMPSTKIVFQYSDETLFRVGQVFCTGTAVSCGAWKANKKESRESNLGVVYGGGVPKDEFGM